MVNIRFLTKFFIVFGMIPLLSLLVIGCSLFCIGGSASCCGEKFDSKLEATGLRLSGLLAVSSTQNYVGGSLLAENQTVLFDKLGIQIQSITRSFSFNVEPEIADWFSKAYACSPADPEPVENIANIEIYANQDFDATHPQGTDLSDLFEIIMEGDYWNQIQYPVKLSEFLPKKPKIAYIFTLLLKSAPQNNGIYTFKIKYTQTNNEKFEISTYPITINKE